MKHVLQKMIQAVALLSFSQNLLSHDEPIIRLVVAEHIAPNALKSMKAIYYSLFDKVGRKVEIVSFPSMRSEKLLELDHSLDGDAARIPSYGKNRPYLVMVSEPTATTEFSAYSAYPELKIPTVKELVDGKLTIAYPAGNLMLRQVLLVGDKSKGLIKTWSTAQGLGLAKARRVDVFIDIKINIEHELSANPEFKQSLHYAGSPVKASFHIFLRKEHEALAKQLSDALVDLKKEGLYKIYVEAHDVVL